MPELLKAVKELGALLDDGLSGGDISIAFPKLRVITELETIMARVRAADPSLVWQGCIVQCLLDMKVSFYSLTPWYMELLQRDSQRNRDDTEFEQLELLDSVLFALHRWIEGSLAHSAAHENDARQLMPVVRADRSGRSILSQWLEIIRNKRTALQKVQGGPFKTWLKRVDQQAEDVSRLVDRFRAAI